MPDSTVPAVTIELLQSHSLATAVRYEIERRILAGQIRPGEKLNEEALAADLRVSRGPVREAFRALEQAGLVTTEKIGRVRTCRLGPRQLEEEAAWIERYRQLWAARFDALDEVIEELKQQEKAGKRRKRKRAHS